MTTISDIARLASVGVGTVSRVISGKGSVSEKTRTRVLEVMKELDYRPNGVARSLASRKSNSIGVMVPEFQGRYFGRLIAQVEKFFRAENRHILVASGSGGATGERDAINYLRSWDCDGLILYSTEMSNDEIVCLAEAFPNIALVNRLVEPVRDHCFYIDHVAGGEMAARRLLKAGHGRIACITGPMTKDDARARQSGFEMELTRHGLLDLIKVEGNYTYESGAMCMSKLWENRKWEFTAIFCGNDEMAIGALFKLAELGVRVPDDVSIVGYDNSQLSFHTFPKLTTIMNPVPDIAANAANFIRNTCYEHNIQVKNALKPALVERDSVRDL
ncbi:MAG: LacI family transcriptional regulator [Hyphomicrobiales bacterium]|nr:LacI family transcriptional regulator [Hyphomicrobiales bacterium]